MELIKRDESKNESLFRFSFDELEHIIFALRVCLNTWSTPFVSKGEVATVDIYRKLKLVHEIKKFNKFDDWDETEFMEVDDWEPIMYSASFDNFEEFEDFDVDEEDD